MATFSERIKELRLMLSLTQDEVASQVNLNKQTISQYELGKRQPDFDKLELLCDFFNVSSDYLLGKSDVTARLVSAEELEKLTSGRKKKIPVLGSIAAGAPAEAIQDIRDFELIPDSWTGEYGALRVRGDSMAPTISNGDTVIFRKQDDAESGALIVALLNDNETTVKKLIKNESSVTLQPFNPEYDPIVLHGKKAFKQLKILGKVVESRRRYM